MSQIIFGGTVSMLTVATPSTGWLVGYDDDGVLKQKDIFGIITTIGSGAGATAGDLQAVLSLGNDSGANSIIMGTSTFIKSKNGGGKIELDYNGLTNSILITTDNSLTNEHGLILQNGFAALFSNGYKQAIELENGNGDLAIYNINGQGSVLLGVATGSGVPYTEIDEIKISYNSTSTQSTGDFDKQAVFIGTRNSKISNGVVNSVVIGGVGMTASVSESVYVPNIYLQNQKGIKSTDSNEVFYLNDNNGYTLLDRNSGNLDSSWLLMANDYQSTYQSYIEFGVNSDSGYGNDSLIYIHNSKGPSYSYDDYSYVSVGKNILRIGTKDVDGTGDEVRINLSAFGNFIVVDGSTYSFKGLEYGDDYSTNFVTHSIVDKKYVDGQISAATTPNIATVLGVGNDTNTRSIIMGTSTNIRSGNPSSGGQINFDFNLQSSVLISTDNAALSAAYVLLDNSNVSVQSSDLYLQANNGQVEIGNGEGLKYTTQQNSFQNRSLIDKEYVDLGTASIWNQLDIVAYSPTSSVTNYFPFYTSTRNLSATSSIYSSVAKTKGDINGTFSTGTLCKRVLYEPVSKKMIVVNETSGNVNIIDSVTKSVIGTVSVGTQPHGIAYNPSTNDVFISNKGSNNVSKFNLDTLIVSGTISVGSFPSGIQYLENKVYVANQISNNISVIDTSTNLISATISTSTPREFTWDSKNRRLWFIGVGPDYVGSINPDINTVVSSVSVGSNPFNIEYDSNNDRIWVTNNGSSNVSVINTNTSLVVATISVGASPNSISYNSVNNYIYVANGASQIIEIDTNSLSISNTITTSSNVGGLSYNDFTSELYFSESSLNRVLAYQTVNTPGRYISIGKEFASSEFDVEGTITTTGFRLRNGAVKDYVLTSDGSGKGTWQPRILEIIGGSGLTGSGSSGTVSLAVDFSVVASVNYVNTGTASIWTAINSISVGGLTPSNGLSEVTSGYVGIGGTVSQNSSINGDSYNIDFSNFGRFTVTASTFIDHTVYSPSTEFSQQFNNGGQYYTRVDETSGTFSLLSLVPAQTDILTCDGLANVGLSLHSQDQTMLDGSTDNRFIVDDGANQKGIVYKGDYTSNFTTYSLVTKGYVDSIASSVGSTNGLEEITPGVIGLGGTLSQNTNINANLNDFILNGANYVELGVSGSNSIKLRNTSTYYDTNLLVDASPSYGFSVGSIFAGGTYGSLAVTDQQVKLMTFNNTTFAQTIFEINAVTQTVGDGSTDNRIIISDNYGKGVVYNGDYTANFTTYSLVTKGYVDSTINGIGGSNGLSQISSGIIGLGGTLSQDTTITGVSAYDLNIFNLDTLSISGNNLFMSSPNQVYLASQNALSNVNTLIVDSSYSLLAVNGVGTQSSLTINTSQVSVGDGSTDNVLVIKDEFSNKGLVYDQDYTSNFTTYSLVTKGYVDSEISSIGGVNGLSDLSPGLIGLGGTLSQNTTIDASNYGLYFQGNNVIDNYVNDPSNFPDIYGQVNLTSQIYDAKIGSISGNTFSRFSLSSNSLIIECQDDPGNQVAIQIASTQFSSGDGSFNNRLLVIDDLSNKGLVYAGDYTSNFTTHSLVTKGWVNSNTTNKYSITQGFTASVTETITHSLGTSEVIVQTYDSSGIMVIPGTVQINGINAVDITFSQTLSTIKIVIIG